MVTPTPVITPAEQQLLWDMSWQDYVDIDSSTPVIAPVTDTWDLDLPAKARGEAEN